MDSSGPGHISNPTIRLPRLLFIASAYASFERQDVELLSSHFRVSVFKRRKPKGIAMLGFFFMQFCWLFPRLFTSRYVFIWFADYHSLLPSVLGRITGKQVVIVVGGYDAMRIPELNYGAHLSGPRRFAVKLSCKAAHRLLPVSEFTKANLLRNAGGHLEKKTSVVYNAASGDGFTPGDVNAPRAGVICVAYADDWRTVLVKGLDRVRDVARLLPDVSFTLVGVSESIKQKFREDAPANLVLLNSMERERLSEMYRKVKVVCLFSRSESFGMSLAEGMLCGCIPVTVTGIGAAEIANGTTGVIAESGEPAQLSQAIKSALDIPDSERTKARLHILDHFNLQLRLKAILAAFVE